MNTIVTFRLFSVLLGGAFMACGHAQAQAQAQAPVSGASAVVAPPVQVSSMRALDRLKGTWSGAARGIGHDGKPIELRQTERVGSMLNGDVLVIEGRGYRADGALAFNAFGTVSADPRAGAYEFRAHTNGRSGTYRMEATPTGVIWELVVGPQATVRYTITIQDGNWHEVGEYLAKDQPPRQIMELKLKRTGDTDWPAANPVTP